MVPMEMQKNSSLGHALEDPSTSWYLGVVEKSKSVGADVYPCYSTEMAVAAHRDYKDTLMEKESTLAIEANDGKATHLSLYRRQWEDSQALDTLLTRANNALANRRFNGPAGENAVKRAQSVECTHNGTLSNSSSIRMSYRY